MRLLAGLLAAGFLVAAVPAEAKPRRKAKPAAQANLAVAEAKPAPQSPSQKVGKAQLKPEDPPMPPVGDKSTNQGAQGRKNATEDAAKAADSPQWEHRP